MSFSASIQKKWKLISGAPVLLLDLVIRIAVTAFLLDDIIEYRALIRGLEVFLPTPVIPALSSLPVWSEWLLTALHIGGLVFLVRWPRLRAAAILVLFLTVFRILGDLMRLQPFVVMYSFTVLMAALPRVSAQARLQALRLMIIGVYFWAGFHKLNTRFYSRAFPWFIRPLWNYPLDQPIINAIFSLMSYAVPVFEALIGIFLIFKNTRALATLMGFIMLITVIACIGPFSHNWGMPVWPWNLYIFLSEAALFLAPYASVISGIRKNGLAVLAVAFFVIAPVFGIWNFWPAALSYKLYSGNVEIGLVTFDIHERHNHLPNEIISALNLAEKEQEIIMAKTGMCPIQSKNVLGIPEWADGMNISVYPDAYVVRTSARGLCPYLEHPEKAILRIMHPTQFATMDQHPTDEPLCPSQRK